MKPRVFIASSTENIKYAHAVHNFMNNTYAHTKLWETVVDVTDYTLPALYKIFHEYEYGIFIFSDDDLVKIRGAEYKTVRDNVILEFGMFIGVNGLENAFIIAPEAYFDGSRIPSDLFGITISTFDNRRDDSELEDTLSSNCLILLKKMKELHEKSRHDNRKKDFKTVNIISYEGELFSCLIDMISNAKKKVTFIITNAERLIVFDLIITIVYARLNDIEIDIHYFPILKADEISYSIEMFSQLGCNVKIYPIAIMPDSIAFISDDHDKDYSKMILRTHQYHRKNVYAYYYHGSIHHSTIKSFVSGVDNIESFNGYIPKISKVGILDLENAFKKVPIYAENRCTISIEDIIPSLTMPQSDNLVQEYKIKQMKLLESIYSEYKLQYYEPTAIVLKNGIKHLIVPPIIENHKGKYLVAEGHTRLFMHRGSDKPITCVVVNGMTLDLPSKPSKWDKVEIAPYWSTRDFVPTESYLQLLRKAEKYLHKGDWYASIKDFH